MKIQNLLTAGLLTSELLFATGEAIDYYSASPAVVQDSVEIQKLFDQNRDFWVAKGLGEIAKTRLVMLNNSDTFVCPGVADSPQPQDQTIDAGDASEICLSRQTVVITGQGTNGDLSEKLVSHEVGHIVGYVQGQMAAYNWTNHSEKLSQATEMSADCYGGMANRIIVPEKAYGIADMIGTDPDTDSIHGSNEAAREAALTGIATHSLAACSIDSFLAHR